MGGVKWAGSDNAVVFTRGSQTCWRTFGMQNTLKKNMSLWPTMSSGCSFFSDVHESALKTAGDVFNASEVGRTQSLCLSKWKSCHVKVSFICVLVCVKRVGVGVRSLFFYSCVCVWFHVCLGLCANIREAWGVVLTLEINGWSLSRRKRPIFYCNNTGTLNIDFWPHLFLYFMLESAKFCISPGVSLAP